ncbi:alpha/beta fold hydrolase [Candidatus Roizmanbacteria bacterium]|nr:alpha/beta fold hydrolase [Candidatus Roizmanbacteria bacterium]
MRKIILVLLLSVFVVIGFKFFKKGTDRIINPLTDQVNFNEDQGGSDAEMDALSIENLRKGNYPGSDIVIEETLSPGSNYKRYIVSYKSEGLKIYALLTVPNEDRPKTGWPVVIFNHGYIPPSEYRTTERYLAYTDAFSRNGYIVFKSDYRGHGSSEGESRGGYGSNDYTIDILNAVASIKKFKDVDINRIGMWGHSMGGFITLRSMVVLKDIKAGVIWAGVVASYPDLLNNWRRGTFTPPSSIPSRALGWRNQLISKYGTPEENPEFWNSISANSFLKNISGPIQLHHAVTDDHVPVLFSEKLEQQMKEAKKEVEFFKYENDDHNIANNFNIAMQRSVEFFDEYLK